MINFWIFIILAILFSFVCTIASLRDRTYYVKLHDVKEGDKITAVVKCTTKKKAYELVSLYLRTRSLPYVIDFVENTAMYFDNNMILVIDSKK